MNDIPETPPWGSCALVTYIPDPLRSVLHKLRQALPGDHTPQPHITILPPRPLKLPVEEASKRAQTILRQVPAFEVELASVRSFPETNFLYLAIGGGDAALRELHQTLNTGLLQSSEEFEFRPHLTLGGPVPDTELDSVLTRLETAWHSTPYPRRFTLDELVFLWLKPNGPHGEWRQLSYYSLEKKDTASPRAATAGITSRTL